MKGAEAIADRRAFEVLISAATKLELIDDWEAGSSKMIFVKGPVRYHVEKASAAVFLKSVIDLHEVERVGGKPTK